MACSKIIKQPISLIRVTFEFYPMKGGSITHMIELSKKINPYLKKQLIIAPDFDTAYNQFDEKFEVPITRIKYPKWLETLKRIKIPVVPFVLWVYAGNVSKQIVKYANSTDLIYIHGTLLGAILTFRLRIKGLKTPIVILQESANIFKINKKSALAAHLAFILFKFFKPDCLILEDDGMGLKEYTQYLNNHCIYYEIANIAIDTDFFNAAIYNKTLDNAFTVLSTQRLVPFKNVDLGILAFKKFLEYENYPNNVKMIILGDGSERAILEELTKKEKVQKWIEFHGEKDKNEVLNYLSTADVVIGTSLKSNLNLSIQEAMSCEKTVVAFSGGDAICRLIKNMENGILVKPGDIDEFASKLILLYKYHDIKKAIGKRARETIVKERNWESRINKELKIFSYFITSSTS